MKNGFILALAAIILVSAVVFSATPAQYSIKYFGEAWTDIDSFFFRFNFGFGSGSLDRLDVNPNESVIVFNKVDVSGKSYTMDFLKLEVLDGYRIQAYLKNYDDSLQGKWIAVGAPVIVTNSVSGKKYTLGSMVFDIEQEDNGIEFHGYSSSPAGVANYDAVKAGFEKQVKKALTPVASNPVTTVSEALSRLDRKFITDIFK